MVTWSQPAIDDLKSAYEHIKNDSDIYSNRLIEMAMEKSEMIAEFPKSGRIVPELNKKNFRELFIYSSE